MPKDAFDRLVLPDELVVDLILAPHHEVTKPRRRMRKLQRHSRITLVGNRVLTLRFILIVNRRKQQFLKEILEDDLPINPSYDFPGKRKYSRI